MGVDDYRDREGDAEERTGVGQGAGVGEADRDAGGAVSDYRDTEGDAEARTGPVALACLWPGVGATPFGWPMSRPAPGRRRSAAGPRTRRRSKSTRRG